VDVKQALRGVALLALMATASACGGHSAATRLQIEIKDDTGVHAYRLECDPASGTAPSPRAMCSQLARSPELVVGGPAVNGPCQPGPQRPGFISFHISGSYRGYPVDATFSMSCIVPGQRHGFSTWWSLTSGVVRSHGVTENRLASNTVDRAVVEKRHAQGLRLRAEIRALLARRRRALASGATRVGALGPVELGIIRDRLELHTLPEGLVLHDAAIYSATAATAARAWGNDPPSYRPRRPVYVAEVQFAYRDYAGHRRRDPASWWVSFDGATLVGGYDFARASTPNFRVLGRPARLTFS
jgi:hypothetical protein